MLLKDSDIKTFCEKAKKNGAACIGIGEDFHKMLESFSDMAWNKTIKLLIDNDREKQGKREKMKGKVLEIQPLESAVENIVNNHMIILITCTYYYEIIQQLKKIEQFANTECYVYCFMMNKPCGEKIQWEREKDYRIPAKIHYCWFGGKKMPDLYKRCMESWHKYCSGYEIVEWNERNCDIEENQYVKQAYERGMYEFVSDYFRLKAVYEQGGIYLDTDVELVKSLDILRYNDAFCGMEIPGKVAFGLGFGAMFKNKMIGEFMQEYGDITFIEKDGGINNTPCSVYQTEFLRKKGLNHSNQLQKVHGMTVYPTYVLCPKNIITGRQEMSEYTIAIHHFEGSWVSAGRSALRQEQWRKAEELYRLLE